MEQWSNVSSTLESARAGSVQWDKTSKLSRYTRLFWTIWNVAIWIDIPKIPQNYVLARFNVECKYM